MELKLWKNFKKRINSTKLPADAEATVMQVRFKDDTSIENPSLLIKGIDLDYNYCKMGNHYYYINDIVVVNNDVMQINCIQDVLATYKSDILAASAYVEYSQSIGRNPWIPDTRLQSLNDVVVNSSKFPVWVNEYSGTIILTVAGKDESTTNNANIGFCNYYAISGGNAKLLADKFYDSGIIEEIGRFFGGDISKSLIEAHWVPWQLITTGNTIHISDKDMEITANGLGSTISMTPQSYNMDIPWIYNDWRDMAPYATMTINLPFYGTVQLDQSKLVGSSTINVKIIRDAITGEVIYRLSTANWNATYKADASVALSVGQTTGNKVSAVGGILAGAGALIGGIAAVATSGLSTSAAVAVGGGIDAIAKSTATYFSEETSGRGGTGGFGSGNMVLQDTVTGDGRQIILTLYARSYATSPEGMRLGGGNPVMGWNALSGLSGYTKCSNASINISGLGSDKEAVNQWLNQGFYIE